MPVGWPNQPSDGTSLAFVILANLTISAVPGVTPAVENPEYMSREFDAVCPAVRVILSAPPLVKMVSATSDTLLVKMSLPIEPPSTLPPVFEPMSTSPRLPGTVADETKLASPPSMISPPLAEASINLALVELVSGNAPPEPLAGSPGTFKSSTAAPPTLEWNRTTPGSVMVIDKALTSSAPPASCAAMAPVPVTPSVRLLVPSIVTSSRPPIVGLSETKPTVFVTVGHCLAHGVMVTTSSPFRVTLPTCQHPRGKYYP